MSDKFKSVESLMDGYNPQRQLLEQTRKLVKKWEPTGLLEGLEDETFSTILTERRDEEDVVASSSPSCSMIRSVASRSARSASPK